MSSMRHQMHIVEFPPVRCNNLIAGITAVVGIIGGVLLITKTTKDFLGKITDRKKKQSTDNEYFCNVCCAEIDPGDAKTFVTCYICQKHICRSIKCADWLAKTAQWECELCQTSKESMAQTSSWVADQISFNQEKLVYPIRARSEIFIPISECNDSSLHFESVSQIGASSANITAEQKLKIREYVEEVVAKLLGGNLDTISVNQLSKSENYLPTPKNHGLYHQQNGSNVTNNREINTNGPDFTDISEIRLRQMIQKIIGETIDMHPLSVTHAVSEIALDRRSKTVENMPLPNGHKHRTEHYFEPAIYQDLLATAVLNKIVDKQLNNHVMSESLPDPTQGNGGGDRRADLDQNFNIENQSTTSGSSVEPRSDYSYTDMEQILNANDDKSSELLINAGRDSVMSDYLASHMVPLPDLSAVATESEEDDYLSVTSSAVGDGTWENNWLFKKKKPTLGGNVTATSVGMLVPDPKEDVRAQIGDKTADEVSDLSELGSDTDDSLDLLRSKLDPINDRLINKHLIGGQNSKMVLDELIERSSMISNTLPTDLEQAYTETCNEHVIDAPTKTEAINADVNQQNNNTAEQDDLEFILPPAGFEDLNSNPLSGSIAEREYKKWYNAVDMPNNPYAPEALKRRISGSQERFIDLPNISPAKEQHPLELLNKDNLGEDETDKRESDYRRYSRDYYVNSGTPTSQTLPAKETATKDILEVNNNNDLYDKNSRNATKKNTTDCHWTVSTPVRRSSSLKVLNNNITSPPSPQHSPTNHKHRSSILQPRPSTSASYYNNNNQKNKLLNDDDVDDEDLDLHSQRSWKSSSALSPKRRTVSMLSVYRSSSRCSNRSSHNLPDANVLTQFEKQLLHKDLKRNSFRAVTATTKDFVINPLYEKDQFFSGEGGLKLSLAKPMENTQEQQAPEDQGGDSGVDSCLNGFSEKEGRSKYDDNKLLF